MASIAERPTKPHPTNVFLDQPRIFQDTKTSCQKTWLGPRLGQEFWKDVEGCWPPQPSFKSPQKQLANSPLSTKNLLPSPTPNKISIKKVAKYPTPFLSLLFHFNSKRPNGPTAPPRRISCMDQKMPCTTSWRRRSPFPTPWAWRRPACPVLVCPCSDRRIRRSLGCGG